MQAAQNAAQVFLGINLKCAACHDSFINRWKLKDTYGLASMFSDQPLELVRCDVPTGTTPRRGSPFRSLKVDFGDTLASRKTAAAEWFTHRDNGRFARTIVNRYWKQLMGRGIVRTARRHGRRNHRTQDLLDWLASDFVGQWLRSSASAAADHDIARVSARERAAAGSRLSAEQFADTFRRLRATGA